MVNIYTARINYKTNEHVILDTTVKSGTGIGAIFAPTWDMVMDSKKGRITWEQYTERYTDLMRRRYVMGKDAFMQVLELDDVVLTCYCADTSQGEQHCHRYLLVTILAKIAYARGIEFHYMGELS